MQYNDFLVDVADRLEQLLARMQILSAKLTPESINQHFVGHPWSPGQLLEHMNISHKPYLEKVREALISADRAEGDVKFTRIGAAIAKAAGPSGNAPVPKMFAPSANSHTLHVLDEWRQLHSDFLEVVRSCKGVDLNNTFVRNPMVRLLKMNLADVFAIVAAHGDRHLGQMEQILKSGPAPTAASAR